MVKLDVEGAEINAVSGLGDLLQTRQIAIVYEDHGKDREHNVSRYLQSIGMIILDPTTGNELTIDDLDSIKVRAGTGYNFLAVRP